MNGRFQGYQPPFDIQGLMKWNGAGFHQKAVIDKHKPNKVQVSFFDGVNFGANAHAVGGTDVYICQRTHVILRLRPEGREGKAEPKRFF